MSYRIEYARGPNGAGVRSAADVLEQGRRAIAKKRSRRIFATVRQRIAEQNRRAAELAGEAFLEDYDPREAG